MCRRPSRAARRPPSSAPSAFWPLASPWHAGDLSATPQVCRRRHADTAPPWDTPCGEELCHGLRPFGTARSGVRQHKVDDIDSSACQSLYKMRTDDFESVELLSVA